MTSDVETRARQRLRQAREDRGWTTASLAARSGVSASTISRVETGGRRLALDLLVPLCRALGVGVDELLAADDLDDVVLRPVAERRGDCTVWPLTRRPGPDGVRVLKIAVPERPGPPDLRTHPGREWLHVLSGRLRLHLGAQTVDVEAGRTAEFSTTTPHALSGVGGTVELLVLFDVHGQRAHLDA